MQIEVSHKHLSTAAEVRANAVAVSAKRHRQLAKKAIAAPPQRIIMRLPEWMLNAGRYDEHVRHWNEWRDADTHERIRLYAVRRAHLLGRTLKLLRTYSRSTELDNVRHVLIWELCVEQFPDEAYDAVGMVINRDHSSILHSLQRTALASGQEFPRRAAPGRPVRRDPAIMKELKAALAKGERIADIAKRLNVDPGAAWRAARDNGWVTCKRTWTRPK